MPASEAQIRANQQNSAKSTGPKTIEGKERSRQNGLKHGMTGEGVVLLADDAAEVELRHASLQSELAPKSSLGQILVLQMATLSVRMERGATQEMASIATRVRHAAEVFDAERIERARGLFQGLSDDPRRVARKLRQSAEGIELMLEAWDELRLMLTRFTRPGWLLEQLKLATYLSGQRFEDVEGTRRHAIARATWGSFTMLTEADQASLEPEAIKAWARARLLEWIDSEIALLRADLETLDFSAIEQDRAEAGARALFDPSKEAALARRYESEARRGFFKALDQFRKAEAEAAEREEMAEIEPAEPAALASSREVDPRPARDPRPAPAMAARPMSDGQRRDFPTGNRPEMAGRKAVSVG